MPLYEVDEVLPADQVGRQVNVHKRHAQQPRRIDHPVVVPRVSRLFHGGLAFEHGLMGAGPRDAGGQHLLLVPVDHPREVESGA